MALKYLTDIDLNNNELQNAVVQNLATAPSGLEAGRIWFNTADSYLYYYNGTISIPIGAVNFETDASNIKMDGTASVGTLSTLARADHVHPSDTSKVSTAVKVDGVALRGASAVHFGTCGTAAGTAAKTVDVANYSLITGARVVVKFTYTNSAAVANLTLNVSSTGAKSIKYRGSNLPNAGKLSAGSVHEFVYDGTNYEYVGDIDINTTYYVGTLEQLTSGVDTTGELWTPKILHDYIASAIGAADAMRFKGTIGTGGDVTALPTTGVQVGDTYRVITAGTYAGQTCEIGDLIIATATTPTWTVAQTNIDGAITSISSGTGISVTGSGASRTVALASGVATAGSKGDTTNQTPSWGDTFKVTSETIDTYGRTTALAEHTVTIPSATADSRTAGLMSPTQVSHLETLWDDATTRHDVYNPALTASSGVCTWTIKKSDVEPANSPYTVQIYEVSSGNQVMADVRQYRDGTDMPCIDIKILSSSNIAASTYMAVVLG